ncbi:hypothetical protein tb265_04140 [Gemmatimonadetes bacterium T265]|nr:hypothetical protein tb265_04140 [Gemmatimonadetes bacterium T265]
MLPLALPLSVPNLYRGAAITLTVRSGMLALLGPNGSGKSQVLRGIKSHLANHGPILLLGAGRLQPLETRRLILDPGYGDPGQQGETTITLHESYRGRWYQVESVQGVLNRLSDRMDIQIKVAERLRALFGREMRLI